MPDDAAPPTHEALVADLKVLREKGLVRLRALHLPALQQAARASGVSEQAQHDPPAIEALLRKAVEQLGGDVMGDAAEYLFGLVRGTIGWKPKDLRERAASFYNLTPDTFRKEPESLIVGQLAEEILKLCHDRRMRLTHMQLERRLPADSRLAVQWVERFEAYYRIWTPAGQLADDLRAAVDTRREGNPGHTPWDLTNTDYDPEDQADGYARFALYAYAHFQLERRRFMVRHGGLWLLSDAEVEQRAADAVYRIGWQNPFNEEDDSWLRRALGDSRHEEQEHFKHLLLSTSFGQARHAEWQEYVASCVCPSNDEPQPGCQVHLTIQACDDYCQIIDEDWYRIADWYHPGAKPRRPVDGQRLYDRLLRDRALENGHDEPSRVGDHE